MQDSDTERDGGCESSGTRQDGECAVDRRAGAGGQHDVRHMRVGAAAAQRQRRVHVQAQSAAALCVSRASPPQRLGPRPPCLDPRLLGRWCSGLSLPISPLPPLPPLHLSLCCHTYSPSLQPFLDPLPSDSTIHSINITIYAQFTCTYESLDVTKQPCLVALSLSLSLSLSLYLSLARSLSCTLPMTRSLCICRTRPIEFGIYMGSYPPNSTYFTTKNLLIGRFNTTGTWSGGRCCGNCAYRCTQDVELTVYSSRSSYAYGQINYLGVQHTSHSPTTDDDDFLFCLSQIDATLTYQRDCMYCVRACVRAEPALACSTTLTHCCCTASKFWAILSLSLLIICTILILGVIIAVLKARNLRRVNKKLISEQTPLVFPGL
jgi:hypothetical protein